MRLPAGEFEASVYVPWTGDVRVAATEPTMTPAVARVTVGRGSSSLVELPLAKPPMVRGIIVDPRGNPLPGRKVFIRFQSTFGEDELVPRTTADSRAGGVSFVGSLSDPEGRARVFMRREVTSDALGRFETDVAYADRVLAWSFDDTFGVAFAKANLGKRAADWDGVVLKFSGISAADHRCLVIAASGFPARNRTYRINECYDDSIVGEAESDDQIQFPETVADDDGYLDCRYLTEGRLYEICDFKNGGAAIRFNYRPGMTIKN